MIHQCVLYSAPQGGLKNIIDFLHKLTAQLWPVSHDTWCSGVLHQNVVQDDYSEFVVIFEALVFSGIIEQVKMRKGNHVMHLNSL